MKITACGQPQIFVCRGSFVFSSVSLWWSKTRAIFHIEKVMATSLGDALRARHASATAQAAAVQAARRSDPLVRGVDDIIASAEFSRAFLETVHGFQRFSKLFNVHSASCDISNFTRFFPENNFTEQLVADELGRRTIESMNAPQWRVRYNRYENTAVLCVMFDM